MDDLRPEDLLHDDPDLLADRLLRSLHRNKDGHLAVAYNRHPQGVEERHNVAILYCYTEHDGAYTLYQHYVHSQESLTYKKWYELAVSEAIRLQKSNTENWYGVYGWLTATVQITPLRTGDLFIKIDKEGARGVRLAFSTRKARHETRTQAKRNSRQHQRNRVR